MIRSTLIILILTVALAFTACGSNVVTEPVRTLPSVSVEPSVVPAATATPIVIVKVVTATPVTFVTLTPTPEPTATTVPVVLPTPTVAPTPPPSPVPVATPQPTATPWVIYEPVIQTVEVTVVVTATATPTATPIPSATPVPTATPKPTATPVPPFIQSSAGKGSWLSDGFSFWSERPIEVAIAVTGSGSFALSAVTPNGCVVDLSAGVAPYTATTLAEPNKPETCDGLNEFGNGTRLTVVAGGSVNWVIDLTQYSQPTPQNAPVSITARGQNIFGPVRLGQGEILAMASEGDTPFKFDVYSIYESTPVAVRVIDLPTSAFGTWFIDVPIGVYMMAVTTDPDRDWTAEIRYQ